MIPTPEMIEAGLAITLSSVDLPASECLHESDVREIQAAALALLPGEAVTDLPADIIESLLAIGYVEWGQTHKQNDGKHLDDLEDTLRLTRQHFGIEDKETAIHGLYLADTSIVLAHTGMSPNSPQHARILAGAWNQLVDIAKGRSALSSPVEGGTEKELTDHAAFDRETEILKERLRAATVGRDAARKALLAGSMNLIPDKVFDAIHEASASPSSAEIEALQKIIRDQKASLLDYSARNIRLNDQHDELQAEIEALRVENERLKEALWPFAKVAEKDIGETEHEADLFVPAHAHNRAPRLVVGDFRRAFATLQQQEEGK